MSFIDKVHRAQALLQEEQRISLRALQRELDLDADAMDALVAELVEIRGVAVRDGKALAWAHPRSARTTRAWRWRPSRRCAVQPSPSGLRHLEELVGLISSSRDRPSIPPCAARCRRPSA